MDAGDADGADALLSLAALANEAANIALPPLPASAARELESKLDDLAKQAGAEPSSSGRERPRRHTKPPPRADVSCPFEDPLFLHHSWHPPLCQLVALGSRHRVLSRQLR